MRYTVNTDRPTFDLGVSRQTRLTKGDVVDVQEGASPDSDGDYFAQIVEARRGDVGSMAYIAASCLTPEDEDEEILDGTVSSAAVHAALVAVGYPMIAAKVLRIAEAIEAAR